MKKTFLLIPTIALLASCGGNQNQNGGTSTDTAVSGKTSTDNITAYQIFKLIDPKNASIKLDSGIDTTAKENSRILLHPRMATGRRAKPSTASATTTADYWWYISIGTTEIWTAITPTTSKSSATKTANSPSATTCCPKRRLATLPLLMRCRSTTLPTMITYTPNTTPKMRPKCCCITNGCTTTLLDYSTSGTAQNLSSQRATVRPNNSTYSPRRA